MKRCLSLILAAMLVIGLVPAAFASDAEAEVTSVTYTFNTNQHGENVDSSYLERRDGTKTRTSYATSGGEWAYLGTTSTTLYSTTDYFASLSADRAYFGLSADSFAAFKVKVPSDGKYKVSEFTAHLWRDKNTDAARDVQMYIVPMTDNLESDKDTVWGTVSNSTRDGEATFASLDITAEPLGTLAYSVASNTIPGNINVSAFSAIDMKAGIDYAVIFYSAGGGYFGPQSFTLTALAPELTVTFGEESYTTDEVSTVQLSSTLALDGADITADATAVAYESDNESVATVDNNGLVTAVKSGTANITVTYTYGGKTYSAKVLVTITDIDKSKTYEIYAGTENSEWSWGGLLADGAVVRNDTYLQLIPRKNYYNKETSDYSRAAIKINVAYNGTYDISARIKTAAVGAEADVYMVPASVAINEITLSYLKNLPIIGRANGIGDGGNETRVIGTATLSAGDYYVVFNFNTDNISTNNQNKQVLNIVNLQFVESDGEAVESPDTITAETPSFAAGANIAGATVTVTGAGEGPIHSVARGTTVKLSASEVPGYNFVGWMRGAYKDNGEFSKFVDLEKNNDGTYSYKVWSSIYLTAVYEPAVDSETKVVKFWNNDGSFLGEKPESELTNETLPTASLIGHTFSAWWVAENKALDVANLSAAVTNTVAQYEAKTTIKTDLTSKKYDEVTVNGVVKSNVAYGTAIPCTDNGGSVTHWLRDGKIVSYNPTYTHYVWDGTNIYSSYAKVEKKPLVVLENTTIDGAYMIEYEAPAGYTIAEVGILFAASGTPNVGSALERYTSQRGTSRGQFAAKPSDVSYVARGYMIYTDNATGNAYVIYSK